MDKKKEKTKRYTIDPWGNKFKSAREMCAYHHINYTTYVRRRTKGYSLEQCLHKGRINHHESDLLKRAKERIGTVVIQHSSGEPAECIAYRNNRDGDYRFPDGTIKTGTWNAFIAGKITKINKLEDTKKLRIGVKIMQNSGYEAECIEYRSTYDIDVRFTDNGSIRQHITWSQFKSGCVAKVYVNDLAEARVGVKVMQKCGDEAECIAYRNALDGDYKFTDGTVVTNAWQKFKEGRLKKQSAKERMQALIGYKWKQHCGLYAELIRYDGTSTDCDFRLSNGQMLYHKSLSHARDGSLNPNSTTKEKLEAQLKARAGAIQFQKCGQFAECIEYNGFNDCTCRLEDGSVYDHIRWQRFLKGNLGSASCLDINIKRRENAVGTTVMQNCGLRLRCIAYTNVKDFRLIFEDGSIPGTIPNWERFLSGKVRHNGLSEKQNSLYGSFMMYDTVKSFYKDGRQFYNCIDQKTGKRSIQTPQEMMLSRGIRPIF